jgi:hypothetical protein
VFNTNPSRRRMLNAMAHRLRPKFLGVWLSTDEYEKLKELAEGRNVSDTVRLIIKRAPLSESLAEAIRQAPSDWRS